MKTLFIIIIAFLILCSCAQHTQGNDWEELKKDTKRLYQAGNFEQAIIVGQQALQVAENDPEGDYFPVASSLHDLAACYLALRRYSEAEPLYKRALSLIEANFEGNELNAAIILTELSSLYNVQGKYEKAEPLQKKALSIQEKSLSPDHIDLAKSYINLGLVYWDQGRCGEAEKLFERALAITKSSFGSETRIALHNLAWLYIEMGKYDKSEELLTRALAAYERNLDPRHPDIIDCLKALSVIYSSTKRDKEAIKMENRMRKLTK